AAVGGVRVLRAVGVGGRAQHRLVVGHGVRASETQDSSGAVVGGGRDAGAGGDHRQALGGPIGVVGQGEGGRLQVGVVGIGDGGPAGQHRGGAILGEGGRATGAHARAVEVQHRGIVDRHHRDGAGGHVGVIGAVIDLEGDAAVGGVRVLRAVG